MPDTKTYKSKLYHIYQDPSVKVDINHKAEPHEPLPDLVSKAYYLLGIDWFETAEQWSQNKHVTTLPVMITVANTTNTTARVKYAFDHNDNVEAWVKNDHLGFEILYTFQGIIRKSRPDFLIKLKTGSFLVLEVKGQDTQKDKTKRAFLDEWIRAVNQQGGFGQWSWAVSNNPSDVSEIIHGATAC